MGVFYRCDTCGNELKQFEKLGNIRINNSDDYGNNSVLSIDADICRTCRTRIEAFIKTLKDMPK
jgi:hypothetical protein